MRIKAASDEEKARDKVGEAMLKDIDAKEKRANEEKEARDREADAETEKFTQKEKEMREQEKRDADEKMSEDLKTLFEAFKNSLE